ncbi:MAG: MFS transporter [Oscillospiraceae bacterium]|nr:MFS transporter [Oscillospiraceae bacterium]
MKTEVNKYRKHSKWMVFAVTSMANLVASFSINSLTLALPTLEKQFGVGQNTVSWLAVVYSLIPCCTLLIFGRTAELYGYKRQFKAGFLFFGAVCLCAPLLSQNIGMLIFFRCLQGLGYSMMVSITQAIVSRSFGESERGKALGINSVFVSVGLAAGPTIGGFMLTFFSWRALFYFNIPFCLLGYFAALHVLPDDNLNINNTDSTSDKEHNKRRMDAVGAILLTIFVGAIVIGLNFSGIWGFLSVPFLSCMAAGIIGFMLFIRYETAVKSPLINLNLFRNKTFSLANTVSLISYLVQQLITYLMPFYLINILLFQSHSAGLIMLISPVLMMFFSPLGGSLADKMGTRLPAGIGLVLICAGCLIMSFTRETTTFIMALAVLALAGSGNGLSVSSINAAIINSVPLSHVGVASGMLATMRNLGQTLGVVCGTVILTLRQPVYKDYMERKAYLFAQRDTYYFGIAVLITALILIFLLPNKKRAMDTLLDK